LREDLSDLLFDTHAIANVLTCRSYCSYDLFCICYSTN